MPEDSYFDIYRSDSVTSHAGWEDTYDELEKIRKEIVVA
jgi:hypothetical protein